MDNLVKLNLTHFIQCPRKACTEFHHIFLKYLTLVGMLAITEKQKDKANQ